MTADALLAGLHARGIRVEADGQLLRCRPKSAMTPGDLKILSCNKQAVLDYLVKGAPGDALRLTCNWCKGNRMWRSTHNVVICGICHPPAKPYLVAEWIGEAPEDFKGA
jgi:hypothetical protein